MVLLNLVADTIPCPSAKDTTKNDMTLDYCSASQEEHVNDTSAGPHGTRNSSSFVHDCNIASNQLSGQTHQSNTAHRSNLQQKAGVNLIGHHSMSQHQGKVLVRPTLNFKKESSTSCGIVSSSSSASSSSSYSSTSFSSATKLPGKAPILDHSSEFLCWGTSYQANDPCEDRYCSLTNVLLSEASWKESCPYPSLRMSLFAVLDGHGGPAVAEYASRHLLPLLARDISRALSCPIVDSGMFQINGKTQSIDLEQDSWDANDQDDDEEDALLHNDDARESFGCSDVESDDSDSDSEASTDLSRGTHFRRAISKWYKAPENDVSRDTSFSISSTKDPGFVPGMHTEQEQQLISSTIQTSFLKLDEQWINSIDPLTSKQSFVVHNGKWNSGACCLVNLVLQRIVSSEDDFCDGDDHDDGDGEDSVQFSDNDKRPKAILYSCHTGDCRAVLFSAQEESENDNRLTPSSQSDDDLFFQESDSDSDSDSDEENDHDAFVNGVTLSRKRMFLNPFQNHCSPPTKRRNIWEEHPIKVQENFHGEGKMTWASSDPSPPRARLLSASRSPSPVCNSTPFPSALRATTLTKDHTPYNQKEASLVRERCNYAPRAISTSTNGGIQRVAGSLSVTRALGDAYLKTPTLSFSPYKAHAPYISALPEVSARILSQQDRLLVLASDGVWERVDGEEIAQWMGDYFKRQVYGRPAVQSPLVTRPPTPCSVERNRSRRMRMLPTRKSLSVIEQEALYARILNMTHVSDMIVSKVLNKVRRKHKMPDIETLMSLPKGHSRRSKHDDITTLVIDLKGFSV